LGQSADLGSVGHTTFRAPFAPVPFAALAGRRRGELFDPARITSIHPWHVAHGAEFEDVGQWKRPWYYPTPGEDMDAAVLRECKAVRESVGFQDARSEEHTSELQSRFDLVYRLLLEKTEVRQARD